MQNVDLSNLIDFGVSTFARCEQILPLALIYAGLHRGLDPVVYSLLVQILYELSNLFESLQRI